ncbi:GNAT family N-acetyltransferase [Chondromyces apiculatus]|uniref:GCN5-related N-acetyltransferase n=1 Tax=Chondromyces apiculatus DSM 436 TaxID=1192034 RepID=A0A017T420_9BACT|nr:GNAT family N-acetyltransferase [Chondromyces apiculatus]EYF03747.1 GCN5-related N-acetyltransferase [Chondromyces apiculatus DSM 436]
MLSFDPFPVLETPRLLLRALTPDDVEVFHALESDPEVVRYFGRDPLNLEGCKERLEIIATGIREVRSIRWALTLRDTGEMIGSLGFWRWNKEHHWAEIGYELATRHWNKGYMSEAFGPVLHHGFEHMGLHRIEAQLDAQNLASARVLEKAGFTREALLRENWFHNGRYTDTPVYGLLRREFQARLGAS